MKKSKTVTTCPDLSGEKHREAQLVPIYRESTQRNNSPPMGGWWVPHISCCTPISLFCLRSSDSRLLTNLNYFPISSITFELKKQIYFFLVQSLKKISFENFASIIKELRIKNNTNHE